MPGVPIDPDNLIPIAKSCTYLPTVGGWETGSAVVCVDAEGRVVPTSSEDALRVYAASADLLIRSSSHTSTTFTTDSTDYQLEKVDTHEAQAVAV